MAGKEKAKLYTYNQSTVFSDGFHAEFHTNQFDQFNPAYFYHYHDYYEIVCYFGDAPLTYVYRDKEYVLSRGDIVLCDMFQPHMYMCQHDHSYERFTLDISPKMLTYFSMGIDYTQLFKTANQHYPIFHTDFIQLSGYMRLIDEYREFTLRRKDVGVQRAMLHLLLAYIYHDCAAVINVKVAASSGLEIVDDLIQYIDRHISEKITLEDLADRMNYSSSYISRIFKRYTGETLVQYMTQKRVLYAKQLMARGLPLGQVADMAGFPTYSHFYKCFSRLEGVSPAEFRKKL